MATGLGFYDREPDGGGSKWSGGGTTTTQQPTTATAPPDDGMTGTKEFNAGQVTDPTMPEGTVMQPVMQVPNEIELVSGQEVDPNAVSVDTQPVEAPAASDPASAEATTVAGQEPTAVAQRAEVTREATAAEQNGATDAYQDVFAQMQGQLEELSQHDPRALVRYQYSKLMDFPAGELPAWAKGAVAHAEMTMASRGLGASSMASEGITAALMQAALPIAQQDAKVFETLNLERLDKGMQAAFLKAGYIADLDLTNLNNRQQSAVVNAKAFLDMDLSNLSNEQQTAVLNAQNMMQGLLSDQASLNATSQFNATSQNQVDQFYANLSAQISTFNASQFLDSGMFNAEMMDMREQFNVKNGMLIEQSNAQYLRDVNTANTAMVNQANFVNTQNLLEISNTAMMNEIQLLRDSEAYIFEGSESAKDRALTRWVEQLRAGSKEDLLNMQHDYDSSAAIGNLIGTLGGAYLSTL